MEQFCRIKKTLKQKILRNILNTIARNVSDFTKNNVNVFMFLDDKSTTLYTIKLLSFNNLVIKFLRIFNNKLSQ